MDMNRYIVSVEIQADRPGEYIAKTPEQAAEFALRRVPVDYKVYEVGREDKPAIFDVNGVPTSLTHVLTGTADLKKGGSK